MLWNYWCWEWIQWQNACLTSIGPQIWVPAQQTKRKEKRKGKKKRIGKKREMWFFFRTGDLTQDLAHARQTLDHRVTEPSYSFWRYSWAWMEFRAASMTLLGRNAYRNIFWMPQQGLGFALNYSDRNKVCLNVANALKPVREKSFCLHAWLRGFK